MSEPNLLIDDETLRSYLADSLPAEEMARVEKSLRDSSELRADWKTSARTKATRTSTRWERSGDEAGSPARRRQQLGSYLLDALDPELGDYLKFHLEVVECPFCQANLADLNAKATQPPATIKSRHNRILRSSQHLLGDEGRS